MRKREDFFEKIMPCCCNDVIMPAKMTGNTRGASVETGQSSCTLYVCAWMLGIFFRTFSYYCIFSLNINRTFSDLSHRISCKTHCSCLYFWRLRSTSWGDAAGPFDWMRSECHGITQLLENGFEDLCFVKGWWWHLYILVSLAGGLNLFNLMIQFDEHIFQMGWNHQLVNSIVACIMKNINQHVEKGCFMDVVGSKDQIWPESLFCPAVFPFSMWGRLTGRIFWSVKEAATRLVH